MLESGLAGAMLLKMQDYFITIKSVFWVEVCAMQIIDNGQVAWWGNSSDSVKRFVSTTFPVMVECKNGRQ
jgi:hypothetical protein